jgi:hypothetical protein
VLRHGACRASAARRARDCHRLGRFEFDPPSGRGGADERGRAVLGKGLFIKVFSLVQILFAAIGREERSSDRMSCPEKLIDGPGGVGKRSFLSAAPRSNRTGRGQRWSRPWSDTLCPRNRKDNTSTVVRDASGFCCRLTRTGRRELSLVELRSGQSRTIARPTLRTPLVASPSGVASPLHQGLA